MDSKFTTGVGKETCVHYVECLQCLYLISRPHLDLGLEGPGNVYCRETTRMLRFSRADMETLGTPAIAYNNVPLHS